jgi:hypothetical protein
MTTTWQLLDKEGSEICAFYGGLRHIWEIEKCASVSILFGVGFGFGSAFGELALLHHGRRAATIRAFTSVKVGN